MYNPEIHDVDHPAELRELKAIYIGYMRSQTMRIPNDLRGWASALHNEKFGRPLTAGCSTCLPGEILSLLINTGIGTHTPES